jgi:hypothetical protein
MTMPAGTPSREEWTTIASGLGLRRDLSLHALDKYTGLKTTWIKF